jgi:putative addiction module antidote
MIHAKIREQGNSYVVTIPREAMEQYHLSKDDTIAFTPVKTEIARTYQVPPELDQLADEVFEDYRAAFEYLADR